MLAARSPYRFYGLRLLRRCEALEAQAAHRFARRHALAVSSGTAALHTAFWAVGVSPGDEVILPAYGWSAALMAILALGATPVIAPIDETLGLDPVALPRCVTKRTRAIIAIHMRGAPCDLQAIAASGKRLGVPVIEDGAQAIGGAVSGLPVGALGMVSVMSFQYNKLLTSGEGGLVLTSDRRLHERAVRFHDLGMRRRPGMADPAGDRCIGSFGLNYRMSELQAALLIAQLKKMPHILAALRRTYGQAREVVAPFCERFHLTERPLPPGVRGNHAFLCLAARRERDAAQAVAAMRRRRIPIVRCARRDAHHLQAWIAWLRRERRPFRVVDDARSVAILRRTLCVEVNAST